MALLDHYRKSTAPRTAGPLNASQVKAARKVVAAKMKTLQAKTKAVQDLLDIIEKNYTSDDEGAQKKASDAAWEVATGSGALSEMSDAIYSIAQPVHKLFKVITGDYPPRP